ncbi:uncharacterized protein MAM_05175 [Metarhizium album ARSEF 1941]|uniref:Uncharacterized protein n=1 Tax=Metarhizium album (strain ARSEF 1941) TaxID=1081103 RepID=A0A0B2WLY3_METAS|nr:uncharacterized protein MAM_05175 [Metarhizium album ARSEF 1941]KHN97066.1 hypothetical protein MAM_05175 [Metarhizium album ARSEF 1941]
MSILSHIRKSRQQAKEHNAKLADQKRKESAQLPYKHVPTHAATDAFASAPPSWREADRSRIIEQNRRRSAMAASGFNMNMPGVPRVGSSLSHVSYPGQDVAAMMGMPRPYSYVGTSPLPGLRDSREVVYAAPDMAYLHPGPLKGKEVSRLYDSQRISPASSKGDPSPVESSSVSTSSQDELEMKSSTAATTQTGDGTIPHRLHPGRARRALDVSMNQHNLSSASRINASSYIRDSRPPPSMRGFGSIPAVAAMQPTSIGILPGNISAHRNNSASPSISPTPTSRRSSSASLSGLSAMPARQTASTTPSVASASKTEYPLNRLSMSGIDSGSLTSSSGAANNNPPRANSINRHTGPINVSQDADDMRQHSGRPQASTSDHQRFDRGRLPPPLSHEDLVNVFPEQAGLEAAPAKNGKTKKLSKTDGGRLVKKNRWSTSKVSVVAV